MIVIGAVMNVISCGRLGVAKGGNQAFVPPATVAELLSRALVRKALVRLRASGSRLKSLILCFRLIKKKGVSRNFNNGDFFRTRQYVRYVPIAYLNKHCSAHVVIDCIITKTFPFLFEGKKRFDRLFSSGSIIAFLSSDVFVSREATKHRKPAKTVRLPPFPLLSFWIYVGSFHES